MQTEAQKRAKKKYDEKTAVYIGLKLNRNTDADIIEFLNGIPNRQSYIKALLRDKISQETDK